MVEITNTEQVGKNEAYWMTRARRLVFFVNVVAWLERFLPVFIGLNLFASCLVIYLRGQRIDVQIILWGILVCLVVIAFGIFVWICKRGLSLFSALLRIETAMGLNNALTTAYQGRINWPNSEKVPGRLYRLHLQRSAWASVLSAILLVVALLIPIGHEQQSPLAENPLPSPALSEVEEWIEQISEESFVEEAALEELQQAVEDMKSRPESEWYTAGALEAADRLNEEVSQALSTLAHELHVSNALLQGAETLPEDVSSVQLNRISEIYQESIRNLETGALPLNSGLLDEMRQVDFNQMDGLDMGQLKALQSRSERMAEMAQRMSGMTPEEKERLQNYYDSLKQGMCEGPPSKQCVPGSIGRGRDDAEMSYSQYRSPDQTSLTEGVSNTDLRQAAIGDTIKTNILPQGETDTLFLGSSQGGRINSTGDGGDAVWVDRLTPNERKVLQNYFK